MKQFTPYTIKKPNHPYKQRQLGRFGNIQISVVINRVNLWISFLLLFWAELARK
jgi:hypothetical protein